MALRRAAGRILRASLSAVISVAAAGCAGSPGSGGHAPSAHPATTAASPWAQVDRELTALAPDTGLLVARVSPGGTCMPVNQVAAATARPLGSMFKLFVLGALARQIASGRVSWNQELTVTSALRSAGSTTGSLQYDPAGTRVSVRQAATKMISISDNTAADMLIHLVGRSAVQAQVRRWSDHAALDIPFLTTRETFLLKDAGYPGLAPIGSVLSVNNGGIGLDRPQWPTVWYKGGYEPGVLTGGFLATNSKGQTFVVVEMLESPAAWLYPSASIGLQAIASSAFATLSPQRYKPPR